MALGYEQRCTGCGHGPGEGFLQRCPLCGGLIEICYDLAKAELYDSEDPYERFFDVLPITRLENVLRLGDGRTPCVHAKRLGSAIGLERLYLKLEGRNPTGTTKDRLASVVLSRFRELGIDEFVTSSTGNTSNALARGVAMHPYFRMHVFVGSPFAARLTFDDPSIAIHIVPDADYSGALDVACRFASEKGLPFEAGFFNPGRREGLKMAFLEAADQIPGPIDWYVQGVSSAMGVHGTVKAAKELVGLGRMNTIPRVVCVQEETCAPIVAAWEQDLATLPERLVVRAPTGIVDAILQGDPRASYPYVYRIVKETDGLGVRVSVDQIRDAQARVRALEDVRCGLAGATTVAAVIQLRERGVIASDDCVLLNVTD